MAAALLCAPTSAVAATQVGETFTPSLMFNCAQDATLLQSTSPASQYAAPFSGVFTSWSYQALSAGDTAPLKFKVGRPAGGNDFRIIGESGVETPAPNALSTFGVRIPAQAGDVIGFTPKTNSFGRCVRALAGYAIHYRLEDVPPGDQPLTFTPQASPETQLDLSASLEPDADNDGFGDETQDQCVGQAGSDSGCPPPDTSSPDTSLTKRPKDKGKKKRATFEFSSSEPGATFECSLDGGAFAACTSPHVIKVKKGKHSFEVRAKDAAGNADATPASDDWKVKRKRRK